MTNSTFSGSSAYGTARSSLGGISLRLTAIVLVLALTALCGCATTLNSAIAPSRSPFVAGALRQVTVGEPGGTHANAPSSFHADGAAVDAYPAEMLVECRRW